MKDTIEFAPNQFSANRAGYAAGAARAGKTAKWLGLVLLCFDIGCSDAGTALPGGVSTGGVPAATGGAQSSGGATASSGGASAFGGAISTGGTPGFGGASGGSVGSGGSSTGGSTHSGGAAPGGASFGGVGTGGITQGGSSTMAGNSNTGGSGKGGASSGGASAGGAAATGGRSGSGGVSAGGGTGSGGTPAGGAAGFDPCPANDPCKVLPLGDSITDGLGFSGGYRVELFSKSITDKKKMTFVGGKMNGPNTVAGVTFPKNHEGYSGYTIKQIDDMIPDKLAPRPHIVLLHLGTNDMYQSPAGAPERLGTLIDQILAELPDSLLVVSTIIPFPSGANAVSTYNAAVPGVVEKRASAGKHIVLVDQFKGFPTSELGDGVHPNEAGYKRMAGVWYEAIKSYLH